MTPQEAPLEKDSSNYYGQPSYCFTDPICSSVWSSPRIRISSHKGLSAIPLQAKW